MEPRAKALRKEPSLDALKRSLPLPKDISPEETIEKVMEMAIVEDIKELEGKKWKFRI